MPEAHSKFSASNAEGWIACAGRIVLTRGLKGRSSIDAAKGTVVHKLIEEAMRDGLDPRTRFDERFEIDGFKVDVDETLVGNAEWALRHIAEITAGCDIVLPETQVNYAHWIQVPKDDGWGTSDVIAVHVEHRELITIDYKNGRKPVSPVDNPQMMLYSGGALSRYEDVVDIDTVRMVILQPDAGAPKEHVISVDELKAWLLGRARSAAASALTAERLYPDAADGALPADWIETFLSPGSAQCQWCKAKATCPALRSQVLEAVTKHAPASPDEFEDLTIPSKAHITTAASDPQWLGKLMDRLDMIEDWCKAVRSETERRLLAGEQIPGYKIVEGKLGNRAWSDKAAAEEMLKSFRLKTEEMYDLTLISPTSAEKLTKGEKAAIGPRQWPKLNALVTRAPGKPHVAPESDPRPSITVQPVDEMFEVQAGEMV